MSEERDHAVYSIGAVSRMLDLPSATIRAWEERYSLIAPARSEGSQRLYSRAQVEQLRFIKAQIESGVSAADAHRLLAEQLRTGQAPLRQEVASEGGPPLVLIADRDPYAADHIEHFLRAAGYRAEIALDAAETRRLIAVRSPDVVIVDLLISGVDGFQLVAELAGAGSVPVLAVAAVGAGEDAMRAGAAAFIKKPIEPARLVETIRDLLRPGAYGDVPGKKAKPR